MRIILILSDDICKNGRVKYENHQKKYDEYKDKNGEIQKTPGVKHGVDQLQFIIVNYLYEPDKPYEPIDMAGLFLDLDILGKLIHIKLHGSLTTYESPFTLSTSSDK